MGQADRRTNFRIGKSLPIFIRQNAEVVFHKIMVSSNILNAIKYDDVCPPVLPIFLQSLEITGFSSRRTKRTGRTRLPIFKPLEKRRFRGVCPRDIAYYYTTKVLRSTKNTLSPTRQRGHLNVTHVPFSPTAGVSSSRRSSPSVSSTTPVVGPCI